MKTYHNRRLQVMVGDITQMEVDAIVNAANSSLQGGGGVDGAIHRAGGRDILRQCQEIRHNDYPKGLPTGRAVLTTAGDLPVDAVIHTVGPRWRGGTEHEDELLEAAYRNSLDLAAGHAFKTIAFPSISTGAYGFPRDRAAAIAYKAIASHLFRNTVPHTIYVVLYSEEDYEIFTATVEKAQQ